MGTEVQPPPRKGNHQSPRSEAFSLLSNRPSKASLAEVSDRFEFVLLISRNKTCLKELDSYRLHGLLH